MGVRHQIGGGKVSNKMSTTYNVAGYHEGNGQKIDYVFESEREASHVANKLSDEGWSISLSTIREDGIPDRLVTNDLDKFFGKTVF